MGCTQQNNTKSNLHQASHCTSRREVLKITLCLSLGSFLGCTPLRLMTGHYPGKGKINNNDEHKTLCAFTEAVIPGVGAEDSEAVQVFYDQQFPLAKHRGHFVFELDHASRKVNGSAHFYNLSLDQRSDIVRRALDSGSVRSQLFNGAIMLTQVAFYAGLYKDSEGCPTINFPGNNYGFPPEVRFQPDAQKYLSSELTPDGNYI